MIGLMGRLQGLQDQIDLNNTNAAQVVLDTLALCGAGDIQDDLVMWLRQNTTFHDKFLIDCLNIIVKNTREQKKISISALKNLLLLYNGENWNHETISSAISVLFLLNPNFEEENVKNLIKEVTNHKNLGFLTFLKWVAVFKYKEDDHRAEKGENRSIFYPILDELIQRSIKDGWNLKIDSNNKEQKDALEFALACYKGHTKLGEMTAEKLIKEIAGYIKAKKSIRKN
jgi:hypothetical protein